MISGMIVNGSNVKRSLVMILVIDSLILTEFLHRSILSNYSQIHCYSVPKLHLSNDVMPDVVCGFPSISR